MEKEIKSICDKLNEKEMRELLEYYKELIKALREQIEHYDERDADFTTAIEMYDNLSDKPMAVVDMIVDYTMGWRYSDQDIVELTEELINYLKGEK